MIYKSIAIAVIASFSLLACGGGGSATPAVPMPPALVSGLFAFAGSHDIAGAVDGNALDARFQHPDGFKSDVAGNLYLTDNNTIRKISPTGVVSTVAGIAGQAGSTDGVGTSARFSFPADIAIDANGNLYVADSANHTIRKITPGGVVTTPYGRAGQRGSIDGRGTDARFNSPTSITIDLTGSLYVADFENHTIRRITPDGVVSTFAGAAGAHGSIDGNGAAACFHFPSNVAADTAGNIFVADLGNRTIRKITASGMVSTLAGDPTISPEMIPTEGCSNGVDRINGPEFINPPVADGIGKLATFSHPTSLAVDPAGNVFVGDDGSSTIRKITPVGLVTTVAGVTLRNGNLLGSLPGLLDQPRGLGFIAPGILITKSGYALIKIILP